MGKILFLTYFWSFLGRKSWRFLTFQHSGSEVCGLGFCTGRQWQTVSTASEIKAAKGELCSVLSHPVPTDPQSLLVTSTEVSCALGNAQPSHKLLNFTAEPRQCIPSRQIPFAQWHSQSSSWVEMPPSCSKDLPANQVKCNLKLPLLPGHSTKALY